MVARRLSLTWYMQGRGKTLMLPHLQRNICAQRLSPRALTGKSQSVINGFLLFGVTLCLLAKRLSKIERAAVSLPGYAAEALVGLLLGDGWMTKNAGQGANARFGYAQSGTKEKQPYFYYVFDLFSCLCTAAYTPLLKTFTRAGYDTVLTSLSFCTMRLPALNTIYLHFYVAGVKIVPLLIGDLLTPVGLAFWIMDDGSRQGTGLHLNVYGFDNESVDRLLDVLQGKFNLECTLHGHSAHGGKFRIYVRADSMPRLRELVLPHMHPSMLYKLGL